MPTQGMLPNETAAASKKPTICNVFNSSDITLGELHRCMTAAVSAGMYFVTDSSGINSPEKAPVTHSMMNLTGNMRKVFSFRADFLATFSVWPPSKQKVQTQARTLTW
jgi:hypothetical protein